MLLYSNGLCGGNVVQILDSIGGYRGEAANQTKADLAKAIVYVRSLK